MKVLILIQLLFCFVISNAQPPKRFYTKFGGNGIDIGYSAKPTKDKQYIVAGSTSSYGYGNTDVYLVKVDSMGYPIWEKYFGGFNNDVGRSVVQLPDSGYVVAGFTNSFGAGGYDAYMIRTDKNGNLIWQKAVGGLDWDFAYDLVLSPDGNIVVCGNTSSFGAGKKDGLILKLDLLGNLIWQKTIGGIENEELKSVIITNDNFLATVGYTESNGDVNGDVYFYKFDLSGTMLFDVTYGGTGKDYANDVVQKLNGDYVLCGAKTYSSSPKTEPLYFSIAATGAFLWENHFTDNTNDDAFSSNCTTNNPSYVAYIRDRPILNFKSDVSIYIGTQIYLGTDKITENGGYEDEFCYSIERMPDGGYVTVGVTYSFGSINGDVYFLKQDSNLINNASLVGLINQTKKEIKPTIRYISNSEIEVTMAENIVISNYNVLTMTGSSISSNNSLHSSSFKIDLTTLSKGILILEVKLKSGAIFHYKLLNN